MIYEDMLKPLGLRQVDLNLFGGEVMLAFKNSVTRPCGMIYLTLSIGEETHQRRVTLMFLVI